MKIKSNQIIKWSSPMFIYDWQILPVTRSLKFLELTHEFKPNGYRQSKKNLKETAKIVFEFWWFTLPNNLTIKILYENRLLYFYNRVSNKFGKILKGAYKSYSELTVFIEMMVSHDAWVVLNTYPSTNGQKPIKKINTGQERFIWSFLEKNSIHRQLIIDH